MFPHQDFTYNPQFPSIVLNQKAPSNSNSNNSKPNSSDSTLKITSNPATFNTRSNSYQPLNNSQVENGAVAAAAAAASMTALSVIKTPQAIQAASAPNGPGKEILEQTQHYLSLLVQGFQTQASKVVSENGGQFFEQIENITEKPKVGVNCKYQEKNDTTNVNRTDEESSVIYTWKGDGRPRRFFILKALSKNDLDAARQENKWSTQPQNEDVLNRAFNEASHVILFMSANKQRGFYGLARMIGNIPKDKNVLKGKERENGTNNIKDESDNNNNSNNNSSNSNSNSNSNNEDLLRNKTGKGMSGKEKNDTGDRYMWSAPGKMQNNSDVGMCEPSDKQHHKSDPVLLPKTVTIDDENSETENNNNSNESDNNDNDHNTPSTVLSHKQLQSDTQALSPPSPIDNLPPNLDNPKNQNESQPQTQQKTRTFGNSFQVEWLSTTPVPFS